MVRYTQRIVQRLFGDDDGKHAGAMVKEEGGVGVVVGHDVQRSEEIDATATPGSLGMATK